MIHFFNRHLKKTLIVSIALFILGGLAGWMRLTGGPTDSKGLPVLFDVLSFESKDWRALADRDCKNSRIWMVNDLVDNHLLGQTKTWVVKNLGNPLTVFATDSWSYSIDCMVYTIYGLNLNIDFGDDDIVKDYSASNY
ncbi:MAG: hypothetical protein AAF219_11520 [Myxococcota bacterium]